MDAISKRGLKIGIWAASVRDRQGECLRPGREKDALEFARALLEANPEDEAVLALDRAAGARQRLASLVVPVGNTIAPPTTLLGLIVSAGRAVKRAASAAKAWAQGSLLRKALVVLAALPFLPLLLPALIALVLVRRFPVLRRFDPRPPAEYVLGDLPKRIAKTNCDAWLVLSPLPLNPFPAGTCQVWMIPDAPLEGDALEAVEAALSGPSLNQTLFVLPDSKARTQPGIVSAWGLHGRYRVVSASSEGWRPMVAALRAVLAEAAAMPAAPPAPAPARVWTGARRARIHLFLPAAYQGGVWEASRTLLEGLAETNRKRGEAEFTVGFMPDQRTDGVEQAIPEFRFERITTQHYEGCCFPWSPSALQADAWYSLVDRFPAPVAPPVPFGVAVYDVIQRFAPEIFPDEFKRTWLPAMKATVAKASLVVTTNPVTERDAALEYEVPSERVALVPVAWEPSGRFASPVAVPAAVGAPDGFILNVTNVSPHKGLACVLRAYATLKAKSRHPKPGLVIAGVQTDQASPDYVGEAGPYALRLQQLARTLGLIPGRDVWFLGFTSDAQLAGLFERCSSVVNAARHDNGTFSLIEAHWFGKPALCSRYATAEALYERFKVPVEYFEPDDHEMLAERMEDAANRPSPSAEYVAQCRAALADPTLSHRRFAEQVYDLLLRLARSGAGLHARAV